MAEINARSDLPVWRFEAIRNSSGGPWGIKFDVTNVYNTQSGPAGDADLLLLAQDLIAAGWDLTRITKTDAVETVTLEPEPVDYPAPTGPEPEPEDPTPDPPVPSA